MATLFLYTKKEEKEASERPLNPWAIDRFP